MNVFGPPDNVKVYEDLHLVDAMIYLSICKSRLESALCKPYRTISRGGHCGCPMNRMGPDEAATDPH